MLNCIHHYLAAKKKAETHMELRQDEPKKATQENATKRADIAQNNDKEN